MITCYWCSGKSVRRSGPELCCCCWHKSCSFDHVLYLTTTKQNSYFYIWLSLVILLHPLCILLRTYSWWNDDSWWLHSQVLPLSLLIQFHCVMKVELGTSLTSHTSNESVEVNVLQVLCSSFHGWLAAFWRVHLKCAVSSRAYGSSLSNGNLCITCTCILEHCILGGTSFKIHLVRSGTSGLWSLSVTMDLPSMQSLHLRHA